MTLSDQKSIDRTAQFLHVEVRPSHGSPPSYESEWQTVWSAKVDRLEINPGPAPNRLRFWFPDLRWNGESNLRAGDRIRVMSDEGVCLFSGFVTGFHHSFHGGSDSGGSHERCVVVCFDHRWLVGVTSPLTGIIARGPDDYNNYGESEQTAYTNAYTRLSGRRAIFNEGGRGNCDPTELETHGSDGTKLCDTPIFIDPDNAGEYWTAKKMVRYILSPGHNESFQQFPLENPAALIGLDHSDWDKTLGRLSVEGLNVIEALDLVCRNLGWTFREDYDTDGNASIVLYKIGSADSYSRDDDHAIILHQLYAPYPNEQIRTGIAAGEKMLFSMMINDDIAPVVNTPRGLGGRHKFECTFNLVPAWLDSQLVPDTTGDDMENLFFHEHALQEMTDKDSKTFYKYYHPSGSLFMRDVGRKWALNESGAYTLGSYDRGKPYNFADVIDPKYILNDQSNRLYGPFKRQLLSPLTRDGAALNCADILVEFSFDSGSTWHVLPATISSLPDEAGLRIEDNLAEMVHPAEGAISGGTLDGVELNYWTSLCDDKLNSRVWKTGGFQTRLRVTAAVQMDQRLVRTAARTNRSGSPFSHRKLYEFSDRYQFQQRQWNSVYGDLGYSAWNLDETDKLDSHLDLLRTASEDSSIAGRFTLDRLWLGDGASSPTFALGDSVEKIVGREFNLASSLAGRTVYPEIVQIIYDSERQRQTLITRDLRYAEVLVD